MRTTQIISSALLSILLVPMALAQTGQSNQKAPAPDSTQKTAPAAEAPLVALDPALGKTAQQAPVLSFLEWKALRVHEAQQKLEQMNKSGTAEVWQEGKAATSITEKASEEKLNFNVDVALQLNVQDYFSMYLKNLSSEDFKNASKKLSPDEVAELLVAYKNSMEKEKKIPLKFSKNPKDNAKSKNTEI